MRSRRQLLGAMTSMLGLILLLGLSLGLTASDDLVFVGMLRMPQPFTHIAEFCMPPRGGNVSFTVTYPKEFHNISFIFYPDAPQYVNTVHNPYSSCEQKLSPLVGAHNNIIDLSEDGPGCSEIYIPEAGNITRCHGTIGVVGARRQLWFLAVANCRNETRHLGLNIEYMVKLHNATVHCRMPEVTTVMPEVTTVGTVNKTEPLQNMTAIPG